MLVKEFLLVCEVVLKHPQQSLQGRTVAGGSELPQGGCTVLVLVVQLGHLD